MAKQYGSYLGGFSGKLGPAIGYMWNGRWCMRSRPAQVHNPRTEAQVAHRTAFKGEVQLAARMRWAVIQGLTASARELGMTAYNLFVSLNQPAFSLEAGQLAVVSVHEGNVLSVSFEKNPLHAPASAYDSVRLYAYSPSTGLGYLTAPVYRRSQHIEALLPDEMAGSEVHLYLMVQDEAGRCSTTAYAGSIKMEEADNDGQTFGLGLDSSAADKTWTSHNMLSGHGETITNTGMRLPSEHQEKIPRPIAPSD